ncbi:hypothetical protein AGATL06_22980 [Agathobaculum sp. TL06]|mgnify:CR=1 FL=1
MSKIDTTQWKDYAIADLFEIKKGTRLTRANMKDGDIRYIGASTFNNGITAQISNDEHLHPANSISVSYNGSVGEAFYQDEPFWASDDVNVLYPKFQLTRNIALFIIPIIKQIGKQYAFIDKWKKEDMERDMLKLPAKSDGTPDFDYMEEYIDKQIARSSTFIAQFRHRVPSSKGKITTSNWKSFRIEQLFDVVKGSRLTKAEMKDGTIRYVGASSFNNGITAYISNTEQLHPANTLTVCYNGSDIGRTFYQTEPYWATDDVNVLYPKFEMNEDLAMFFAPVIKCVGGLHEYGDKWKLEDMKKDVIKLPVKDDGTPDFMFMESYIQKIKKAATERISILRNI